MNSETHSIYKIMTQEEKQTLLVDLCARLPYKPIVHAKWAYNKTDGKIKYNEADRKLEINDFYAIWDVKPYLRPMSSMTEEEKEELRQEHIKDEKLFAECLTKMANGDSSMRGKVVPHFAVDWCNKNHFDYRGLIPMGLGIDCTGLNIY